MRVILEKENCIGCGACTVVCSDFFELQNDKSHLKNSEFNTERKIESLEVEDISCVGEAVDVCPAKCIHLS